MNSENIDNKVASSDEISVKDLIIKFKELFKFLLSKWVLIVLFGLLGGGLGYLYAISKKPIYTATTTFVLEEGSSGNSLGNLGGLASMVGLDVGSGGGIFQGDNIIELYKSRTMIEKTLLTSIEYNGKRELLIDRYIEFNELRKSWKEIAQLKNIDFSQRRESFTRVQDSVLGTIVNAINLGYLNVIKPDKKLSIIKAEVKAPDEFFAKAFNDQIVKNVNDFYVQTKTKKSLDNVIILQQKADSVRSVMNGAIYNAAAVADATPNLNPTRQIQRIAPIQRSQFSAETNKAILAQLVQNLEMSKISLRKEMPLIQVVDKPIFPLLKEKFGRIKGIIIGGFLAGFLVVFILLIRKLFKSIMA